MIGARSCFSAFETGLYVSCSTSQKGKRSLGREQFHDTMHHHIIDTRTASFGKVEVTRRDRVVSASQEGTAQA
jgi:hypothetical protein